MFEIIILETLNFVKYFTHVLYIHKSEKKFVHTYLKYKLTTYVMGEFH